MNKRLPLPVGTVLQKRYRILRQLGHGGFGAVYEAVDDELNLSFALKETFYADNENLRKAFKREAQMLASLSHESFPRVTHYFTEGDGCFLVMELIYGDDLDKLLSQRNAPFEQEQILTWADQILDALEDLHEKEIIHRDIKPQNLKLTPKGKIKLLDFGIAKGAIQGETAKIKSLESLLAGTREYAPLEQILKASDKDQLMLSVVSPDNVTEIMKQRTDASSDLFSLAATMYHLLTKRFPADAPTRALSIWTGKPDPLIPARQINPQVSSEVSEVLNKAMRLNKSERYQTTAEMRRMLKQSDKPNPAPTPRPFIPEPTKPSPAVEVITPLPKPIIRTNRKWLYAGIGIGGIFLVMVLMFGLIIYFNTNNNGKNVNVNTNRKNTNVAVSNKNQIVTNSNNTNTVVSDEKYELEQTLSGHRSLVRSVAFSPDGKMLASGSLDDTIKLWDTSSGTLKQTLSGHSNLVSSVAFSPDGKMLASGSWDKTIKLWDTSSGTLKQTLSGHSNTVRSVAFSPDGKMLASGSWDKTIKLWDTSSGTLKQTLSGHSNLVNSVAFSPDGKMLASGSDDETIKLWDVSSGSFKQTLSGHSDNLYSVAFSPDGKTLASGSRDKTIKLWDTSSGTLKQTLSGHSFYVNSVAFSPDGKMLASGSSDDTIKLWDTSSGTLKQTLSGHSNLVSSVAFSPDGKMLASGSDDKTIKLWRVKE